MRFGFPRRDGVFIHFVRLVLTGRVIKTAENLIELR